MILIVYKNINIFNIYFVKVVSREEKKDRYFKAERVYLLLLCNSFPCVQLLDLLLSSYLLICAFLLLLSVDTFSTVHICLC